MLNSGIIDLAIGLAFIFGVTAALASVITEMISRFLGLRGAYLLAGLRELLDTKGTPVALKDAETDFESLRTIINQVPTPSGDPVARPNRSAMVAAAEDLDKPTSATSTLLGSPILLTQGMTGKISTRELTMGVPADSNASGSDSTDSRQPTASSKGAEKNRPVLPESDKRLVSWSMRRSLPSYISAKSFADAVIDMLIPDKAGQTSMSMIQHYIAALPDSMKTMRTSLQSLATNAGDDVTRFRTSVESWYDDHMARVSGWYKRRTTLITFIAGGILVLLLNINAITIGRALYSDSATRTAVSAVAAQGNPCPASSPDPQSCLSALEKRVSDAAQAGLPLGWGIVPACTVQGVKCGWLEQHGITTPGDGSWWQVFLAVLGFLATIVALAPGAQFWFGLVVKLNSLRASGPPPASSASSAS